MRILMIHPHDIYHDLEPWTVRITYLAQELVKAGHEVKLVYHLRDPHMDESTARNRQDYSFETTPFHRSSLKVFRHSLKMEKLAWWADVVHFQKCSHYSSIPAIFAAYYHRRPVHYDWDDWEQSIFEQDNHNPLGSWIYFQQMEKHLLKLVDTVSIASNGLRKLTERFSFPQDRVFFVPVGADLNVFSHFVDGSDIRQKHGWKGKIVLYQGQISGANYVHIFIKTAKSIISQRQDVTFVVVGGGDKLSEAKEMAQNLDVGERLVFTDIVPHVKVPYYIAAADVAVACFEDNHQSRCKSPLKVVEYMASGKAIVASRVGEVASMIGNCGLLVDPEKPEAMADAVSKLLDDPELRDTLSGRAQERAKQTYSWYHSAQTLIEAYKKAIKIQHGLEQN